MAVQFRILCNWNLVRHMKNWKQSKFWSLALQFRILCTWNLAKHMKHWKRNKSWSLAVQFRILCTWKLVKKRTVTNFSRIFFSGNASTSLCETFGGVASIIAIPMGWGNWKNDQPTRVVVAEAVAVCPFMFNYKFIFGHLYTVLLPVIAILIVYALGFCRKIAYNLPIYFLTFCWFHMLSTDFIDILSTMFRRCNVHHLNILSTVFWTTGRQYSTFILIFFNRRIKKPYHILSTSSSV